jgi:hypothetical protein
MEGSCPRVRRLREKKISINSPFTGVAAEALITCVSAQFGQRITTTWHQRIVLRLFEEFRCRSPKKGAGVALTVDYTLISR